MHFKISLIFLFQFFVIFQNFPSFAKFCGGKAISSFTKKLKYEPEEDKAQLEVKKERRHSFSGGNGKVYIGYVKNREVYEGCVAIKVFEPNFYNVYENSKNFMQKIQSVLSPEERKHLITMIDAGKLKKTEKGVIIMELGTMTLQTRIYGRRKIYANDKDLFEEIKKIVQPISELHKVAIHGDIKPANFIYVKKMDEDEILKLIDYDGATIIPIGLIENSKKMANKIVEREFYVATATYTAIEYYQHGEGFSFSTKMDIWALGIIIYELILIQTSFNERINVSKMTQILLKIGDIYMDIQRNSKGTKETEESLTENPSWIRNNYENLMTILHIWQKYPKTALLIANILHPSKAIRMSAIGIKNFLNGSCLTEELKRVENVAQFHFLNKFSFGQFYQMVEQQIKTLCCSSCNCTAGPTYDALLEKVDRTMSVVQGTMNELRNGGGIWQKLLLGGWTCDTERNG